MVSDALLAQRILEDQCLYSKRLKWVHSLLVGIDVICKVKEFVENDEIVLTNAKGAFSDSLAEFIVYSIIQTLQPNKYGNPNELQVPENLMIGVIGFGDIGFACSKMIINTLNCKVIGIKRDPSKITQ